ncbi:MAG: hypothetical protein ACLUAR_10395 [Pilosibacter sp.]
MTEREPSQTVLSDAVFYEHTSVIYMGKGVKITQTCPSYASCGDIFELKILVENMGQGQSIRFFLRSWTHMSGICRGKPSDRHV